MKHENGGDLFAFVGAELSEERVEQVEGHLSSCGECGAIVRDLRDIRERALLNSSVDSRRFVRAVMTQIEAEESQSRFSFWNEVRMFFIPSVLAAASLCLVVVGDQSSDATYVRADSEYENALEALSGDADSGFVLFGAEDGDGGLLL